MARFVAAIVNQKGKSVWLQSTVDYYLGWQLTCCQLVTESSFHNTTTLQPMQFDFPAGSRFHGDGILAIPTMRKKIFMPSVINLPKDSLYYKLGKLIVK